MAGAGEILDFLLRETSVILPEAKHVPAADEDLAALGYDSMSFIELLLSIERKYGIKLIEAGLEPEDMKSLRTLAFRIEKAG